MLNASWHWLSRRRKFSLVKFMRLGWKRSWNRAWRIPTAKWFIFAESEKSIFITFIQPTPHFYSLTERLLFPSRCWIDQMSREPATSLWAVPSGADSAALGEGGCSALRLVGCWAPWTSSHTEAEHSGMLPGGAGCGADRGDTCHSALLPFVSGVLKVIGWPLLFLSGRPFQGGKQGHASSEWLAFVKESIEKLPIYSF